ncbi:type-F conjugative transfer system mating-pair stabilization protein TraN [Erwinia tasmaniensis]|uniref:type-F conjugative transfer system mating-pair stabilization protein TraN n=1 Tax=Erwinia tasmaniensis TaxID=338565 RepID=UPI0012FF3CBC|nr:type-F conjugative transfer system mating-pair stabilization protein TraN [Erwinia tasmaniensis]
MKLLKKFLPQISKKKLFLASIIAFAGIAIHADADDMDAAFSAGSSISGNSKDQGNNALSQSGVTNTVPSATSNPAEAGYYGGVKGSSSSLDSAKGSVPSTNEAYQSVSNADRSNPPPTIDPNADFIQNGVKNEAGSASIVGSTNSHCTTNVVSKSVFQNYTCEKDLAELQTCARTGSITFTGSSHTETRTLKLQLKNAYRDGNQVKVDFTFPDTATFISGSTQLVYTPAPYYSIPFDYYTKILGSSVTLQYGKSADSLSIAGVHADAGQTYSAVITMSTTSGSNSEAAYNTLIKYINDGTTVFHLDVTYQITVSDKQAATTWAETCNFDKSTATASADSVCTDPGGTRTVTSEGQTYSQTQSCWQYSDSYVVPVTSTGNCSSLIADKNCTVAGRSCTDSQNGTCMHEQDTYQCQKTYTSEGQICGGNYFCQSGDCGNTQASGDNEFGQIVAELAAVAAAGDDSKKTSPDISIFTGKAVVCRKAMANFENCCIDSGWGGSVGLAHCNSEEKAIAEAKEKKVIIKVGAYCGTRVLGVCVQQKESYCQFEGKLAKIIQEQGRFKQLNISFGNSESPDCRGLTVDELQSVNFDKIDYADFYSEVQGNVKLPQNQETIDRIKAKINNQVSNMGDQ